MLKPIKTSEEYENALARVYELIQLDLKEDSDEFIEYQTLVLFIEAYEEERYKFAPPHPIEAIKFRMDQMNVSPKQLELILGSRSRVSEILNGKRKLSLSMIRRLNKKLHIPAGVLINEY
ncbi:MAG: helix-turn-helix domain-containing protein [Ignavibacteriales bacterium]|nr:MAG: helix-turn-helix domain-containing protein [Ignavibacteriales bacterium]